LAVRSLRGVGWTANTFAILPFDFRGLLVWCDTSLLPDMISQEHFQVFFLQLLHSFHFSIFVLLLCASIRDRRSLRSPPSVRRCPDSTDHVPVFSSYFPSFAPSSCIPFVDAKFQRATTIRCGFASTSGPPNTVLMKWPHTFSFSCHGPHSVERRTLFVAPSGSRLLTNFSFSLLSGNGTGPHFSGVFFWFLWRVFWRELLLTHQATNNLVCSHSSVSLYHASQVESFRSPLPLLSQLFLVFSFTLVLPTCWPSFGRLTCSTRGS